MKGIFRYSSQKLRIWNEMATILLFAIVFLASVKQSMSWIFGLAGIISLVVILLMGIKLYKKLRSK
jgi:putative membrane protein